MGESVLVTLARRTGVLAAERELEESARELARGSAAEDRYAAALERFLSLGGGDFDARARSTCADLGLGVDLAREHRGLSGGEKARVALAAILLARFDLLLLDEPTNDLDLDGLERLERFVGDYAGALVIVSHDRALLERTVTSVLEIDPRSRGVTEWTGRWGEYTARREAERRAASERYEQAVARRRHLTELASTRRSEARARGDSLGRATGGADRRATNALRTKVRQAQRLLERNELPEKPFEPWELRLVLQAGARTGELVARLEEAVVERGSFRLGPITLDLVPGERLALTGANGTGKTTLLQALLGELPLASGRRRVGGATRMGVLTQERTAYAGDERTLDEFVARTGLEAEPARTLLAKFGLGAEHAHRPSSSLSPGSGRARSSRSCRRCASTCSCSTSPRTTSTWRRSSSSSPRSPATTGRSSSCPTTGASSRSWLRRGKSRCRYSAQPLMAVPKRKTSRSRRDKRRAQHGISVPRVQLCPTCKQPKRAHRVCPSCKTYKGRDVEPIRLEAP